MRRYSLTYFLGQSFKGLWRNGVMSSASVMVLMSCLIVMGSFALLVYNINYNIDKIATLNEIVVHVDTSRKAVSKTAADSSDESAGAVIAVKPDEKDDAATILDPITETAIELSVFDAKLNEIDSFVNINDANIKFKEVNSAISEFSEKLDLIADAETRAAEQLYYEQILRKTKKLSERLSGLASLEIKIRALENVVDVELTSKQLGIDTYSQRFPDYLDVLDVIINNPEDNPLSDRFTITYNDNSKVDTLKYVLDNLDPMIENVVCRADIAQNIESIKRGIILIFSWFLLILLVVSVFVIINTIKLAVFARRQEITIMRYVGATGWFIVLPFIFEGVIIGLISSGLAYLVQYYMYGYVQGMVANTSVNIISIYMFSEVKNYVLAGFITVGVLTGILGSSVSLRKYMNA